MKPIIFDSILLAFSMIFVLSYLYFIKHKYGQKPSISASAKYLMEDDLQILFYLFIGLGVCIPLTYIARSWITTIAGMLLFGIGIYTGYDPNLKSIKFQNIIHVLLTNLAILGFIVGIVLMNFWYITLVMAVSIPIIYMLVKKIKYRTWKIEVLILILCWVSLFIERILLELIYLNNGY